MYPLGIVKNIVETVGMNISYAYEDLVFLEHNSFLLQFTDNEREVLIHTNQESEKDAIEGDISRLQKAALGQEMQFAMGFVYSLNEDDEESLTIEFFET